LLARLDGRVFRAAHRRQDSATAQLAEDGVGVADSDAEPGGDLRRAEAAEIKAADALDAGALLERGRHHGEGRGAGPGG
jgi:hypothetical protein